MGVSLIQLIILILHDERGKLSRNEQQFSLINSYMTVPNYTIII